MNRIIISIALFISFGLIVSCSGTEETAQPPATEKAEVQKYPTWYPDQEVVSEKNMMFAYAAAIGKDSASAVSKAISWAEAELESSVSEKLEDIRSEALEESGAESGLDAPEFLIALRKTKDVVSPLVETGNTEAKTVEGYDSYRSFAEIQVPKDKLIESIGEHLSGHEQAWNKMKESKAFEKF